MTEDQSYQLPPGHDNLLDSTANNGIASGCHDFNKYDPYVERIRTLFVPSLEPRIHSCLETFVYRRESGQRSDPPYLKRCLDAAATLRDPVEAFCTKWRDTGFVETMLASVVKFLISNGPIDCFLNSIILNNRLNKVCRDLDALGVEKDLLRYLAVWNYINERDYWLEDDKIISSSKSDESRDSIDRRSDLDVEIGSRLDSQRNDRSIRRAFKRRATDDSSDDQDRSGRASQIFHENGRTRVPFPSRLSIDSSNPEGSRSSSARKKIRSCQAHPCRPATCSGYKAKNPAQLNWDGKKLKLQLCRTSHASLERRQECRRSLELSELGLPCKFDDLIGEIFKAHHPPSSRSFFAQRRKKFKAGVTSVCSRVNETLGKIGRKEVRRCRLHCEILPGCFSFRLIERDRDGSEVCLFSDRVPIDGIDARRCNPTRSSGSEPRPIGDQKNADEAELTIYKNSGFSPADDESRIVRNLEEEAAIKTEPKDILLRLSDVDLEATVRKNVEQLIEQGRREALNRSSEDKVGEPMCGCNTSFDDEAAYHRKEDNEDEGSEPGSYPQVSTGERSLKRSNGNAIADDGHDCDDCLDDKFDRAAKNEENTEAVNRKNLEESARGESSIRSNENLTEGQKCTCGVSSDETVDHVDRAIETDLIQVADRQASGIADSHEEITGSAIEDAAGKDRIAKLRRTSSMYFPLKKHQPDFPMDNQVPKIACACPSDCTCPNREVEENQPEECDSECSCDSCRREDEPRVLKKTEINQMSSLPKSRTETLDSVVQELPVPTSIQANGAWVSASDELQCGWMEEHRPEECDSECSCGSCRREDEPRLLKKTEIMRMPSLLKRHTETLDSAVQDSPDPNSAQRNEALVSAGDEFQCGCLEAQTSSFHSQDLEFRQGPSMKFDIPLETNATRTMSSIEAESQRVHSDRRPVVQRSSPTTNKCPRNSSSEEHPIVSARLFLNNATKTMSFIEAELQAAQPDRGPALQRPSSATNAFRKKISSKHHPVVSARTSLKKYQPDVPADNQLDKIACACPSDCTCPNRGTEESQPQECDSQCSCDTCRRQDESWPSKKTEIIRMSSLLRPHTDTLDSAVQDSPDPTSTLKNGASLVSAGEEFQRGCTEAQTRGAHSQDLESHAGPSTKSDTPLETQATKTMSLIEAQSPPAQPDRGPAIQSPTSLTNKSPRNVSSEEPPIVSTRLSRPKGQRINISIEVCPESESSTERTRRNEHESTKDEFEDRKDATSFRKTRRHSLEPQSFGEQVLLQAGKDAGDELLEQPGFTDAGLRSPLRPLESSDYLPPFRPPSSMRNPIVYGTSTKSGRPPIGEMDERSASRDGRRRGDSCVTKNRHGSIQRKDRANEQVEMPKNSSRLPSKPDAFSSSGLRNNIGRALSSKSVDRMKHLIRTKLRRMLLERDKATNTPKTTLTNKKYRVSVPGGKTDRSPFGQQPCRTIWESRSASDSVRTSRSFASDDCTSPAGIRGREEAKKLSRSTGNPRISSSRSRDCGGARRFDGVNSSRNSRTGRRVAGNDRAPEVDLETNFPRLAGGSDFGSNMKRRENMHSSGKRENRCASQNKKDACDEKFINHGLKEVPEAIGDSSAGNSCEASGKKIPDESAEFYGILGVAGNDRAPEVDFETNFSRLAGGSDFGPKMKHCSSGKRENRCGSQNKNGRIDRFDEKFINHSFKEVSEEIGDSSARNSCDASGKKIPDESLEFYGKLDCSGNSTSRHIHLFEFDRLLSSNDETESVVCSRSSRKTRFPEVRRTPRRSIEAHPKKLIVSRARESRYSCGPSAPPDTSAMSDCSSNINRVSVNGARRIGAFGNIDQDLRKKLSQYVNLCKNVKYSLLKRLRPDDIYEVSRTSIPCCDRYKFGDT